MARRSNMMSKMAKEEEASFDLMMTRLGIGRRSTLDFKKEAESGYIDWSLFAYERHNKCPRCKGNLSLLRKLSNTQVFMCTKCKKQFELRFGYDRRKGKSIWAQDLLEMTS